METLPMNGGITQTVPPKQEKIVARNDEESENTPKDTLVKSK